MQCKSMVMVFSIAIGYQALYAQHSMKPDSLILIRTIQLHAQAIYTDAKNQMYILNRENEVQWMNPQGEIINKYSNNYLGRPQFVYFQNPLQVILFYPDFQTLVILDNALNELNRIRLSSYDIPQVSSIGYSPDKGIWYMDQPSGRIKKINQNGSAEVDVLSPPIAQGNQILEIRARKNEVLFLSGAGEFFVIDPFGKMNLSKSAPGKLIEWKEKAFLFFDQATQKIITWSDGAIDTFDLPASPSKYSAIGIITDGLVGLNEAGEVMIYHYY